MTNDAIVQQYLSEIKDTLVCPKSLKVTFLKDLKERIASSQSSEREITRETLCKEFGSPEEIAAGFFDREDYKDLLHSAKIRIVRWRTVSVLTAILLLLLTIFTIYIVEDLTGTITVSTPYTIEEGEIK